MATRDKVLEMMERIAEQANGLTAAVPIALGSEELTLSHAEQLLSFCVRYLAGVDRLYDAILEAVDEESIDEDIQDEACGVADHCHGFGLALQNDVFDKVRQLGGDANRILADLQQRFSSE